MLQISKVVKKPIAISAILISLVLPFTAQFSYAAGNASFSLSPSSGSYNHGANFVVSVHVNSGSESINTVDVKLNYDQSKLQFLSVSTSGSPFNTCFESSGGGGQISIACAKLGGSTTGSQLVGKVTFKALTGAGSTAVTFNSSSRIYRTSDTENIWNGNTSGGTYTFKTPASTPPPSSTPTPSPTPTSPAQSPPTPSSGPTSTSSPRTSTPRSVSPSSSPVSPTSTSPQPTSQTGQTRYAVYIIVIDQDKKPLEGVIVSLGNQANTSDRNGRVQFKDIAIGKHTVEAEYNDKNIKKDIEVTSQPTGTTSQTFTVELSMRPIKLIYILLPPVIIGLGAALMFLKPRLIAALAGMRGGRRLAKAMIGGKSSVTPPVAPVAPTTPIAVPPTTQPTIIFPSPGTAPGSTFVPTPPEPTPPAPPQEINKH